MGQLDWIKLAQAHHDGKRRKHLAALVAPVLPLRCEYPLAREQGSALTPGGCHSIGYSYITWTHTGRVSN
jgi:hypothetical protein